MALTPDQLAAARANLGIKPVAGSEIDPNDPAAAMNSAPVDRAKELTDAWKAAEPAPTYGQRVATNEAAGADVVGQGFKSAASDITGNFSKLQENYAKSPDLLSKTLHTLVFAGHTAGDIAKATGSIIGGTAKAAASPLTQIQTTEGDTIGQRFSEPVKATIQKLIDAHPDLVQKLHDLASSHPEAAKSVGDLIATIGLTGGGKLFDTPLPGVGEMASSLKSGALKATGGAAKAAVAAPGKLAKAAVTPLKQVGSKLAAEGKVPGIEGLGEQTKTSAERLAPKAPLVGAGAARRAKPLDVYNTFAQQEAKHLGDIKQDPAISLVGQKIGDAFGSVVKQRQAAGKTMAAELEKTAKRTVDTGAPVGNFQKELLDNGVTYDSQTGKISAGAASKFSDADNKILEKYASDLQQLGSKPSMKALDAFISRVPQNIKAMKATANINFKTNAERLISNSLNDMRTALGKAGSPAYNKARATYADLSKFVNEGASHLGKITQSGDFAKDASLAKSAVQSVLNNGKKDWLVKLEDLTGYPALDESTLALQAMKDAGDYKGNSLLQLLTEGAKDLPKGGTGILDKIIGFAGNAAGRALTGTKADQTRAFLKSIEETAKKAAGGAPKNAQGAAALNSLEDMYTHAPYAKAHVDDIAREIAKETGGTVNQGPIKGKDRAQEKINQDYGGNHTRLTDLVRNTIVVPHDQYAAAAQMLHNHPDLHGEFKHIKPSENEMGYGGSIAKIKTPSGIVGEIQLNTPEMIFAKESEKSARKALGDKVYDAIAKKTGIPGGLGHKFYEQWRKLDPQSEEATALANKSKRYYSEVVKLWKK